MNDYKELIKELRAHCLCITNGDNCDNCEGLISEKAYCHLQIKLHKKAADAIEQLIKERDAAISEIPRVCSKCEHNQDGHFRILADGKTDDLCLTCIINGRCNFKWRGVQ